MKVLESGIESLKKDMVADTVEDYMDLSFYAKFVEDAFGSGGSSGAREAELMFYTAAIVHSLLEDGLVRAGVPTPDGGFEPWEEDPDAAVERILAEWRALGRRPNLWEIVWFDATEKGEAYAEETLSASG